MTCKLKAMFAMSFFAALLTAVPAVGQKTNPGPGPTQVFVVNGAGSPVPVTAEGLTHVAGTVTVGNTPSVNVTNTPNVNVTSMPSITITGSPTVQVGNSRSNPANALDVERVARIPYESTQTCEGYPQEQATFPGPPSGYRLVLQHLTANFLMNSGATQLPEVVVFPNDGSYTARATFIGKVGGIGSQTFGGVNEDFLSYWDPGSQMLVISNGDFYNGAVNFVTLSGYLENCAITGCPPVVRY